MTTIQTNTPLFFLLFLLVILAATRGKSVWAELPATEKKLRLLVLGGASIAAVIFSFTVVKTAVAAIVLLSVYLGYHLFESMTQKSK